MKSLKNKKNAVSTVVGSMLFLILIVFLSATLFVALYAYNSSSQEAIEIEQTRSDERIVIDQLSTDAEITQITQVGVKNLGSEAVNLAAIYVDNELIFEPFTYLGAKESVLISLPDPTPYSPTSTITVATDWGVKSIVEEKDLVEGYQVPLNDEFYFGPLKLDFEQFYYCEVSGGSYDPEDLLPGWNPDPKTTCVWRITVKNIDTRDLSLSQYSCLTLIDNAGGSQSPWYIETTNTSATVPFQIQSQETVNIFYRWDNPIAQKDQSVFSNECQCRVILTFFGTFDLDDGKKIPYGQTIPFEAVLVTK
jgi:hypothetical protein